MKYILIAVTIGALVWALNIGIDRQERAECIRWQAEALEIGQGWYSTDWQLAQCRAHGLELPTGEQP